MPEYDGMYRFKVTFYVLDKPIGQHMSKMKYDTSGLARRGAFGWVQYNKDKFSHDDFSVSIIEVPDDPEPEPQPAQPVQQSLF